ncbi:MAG TPA: ribonuclease R, partial [Deltaproteobacteria bacterium]|nr:ribonuclease R [Deltaproteobacteria bacterium]
DDAVAIEKKDGHYILYVSIADVSHYVKEGSQLDKEAYLRGTSVYFPDRCIPMLPEHLSNGVCSLNPGEDRLTVTVEIKFSRRGVPVDARFYESVIRSSYRLTYTEVTEMLENRNTALIKKYSAIYPDLKLMEELARKLNRERMKLGSIDFDLPEPEIIIDIAGRPQDIVKAPRTIAHRIIEEFMLAANRKVAELFEDGEYPTIYRVHEPPAPEKIEALREFLAGFGYTLDRKVTPRTFQKLLEAVKGRPEERLINHVMLRAMKQAVYSEENIGHFGLAFPTYTHFTSPIRRYPDLIVHRLLKKLLHKRYTLKEQRRMARLLPSIADNSSKCERRAMEAERECVDLKKAQFMQDKIGEVFEGFISGVESFGFFVELKEYFVEGLVHVTTLRDDFYRFDEKRHALIGENTKKIYSIGKEVLVRVRDVDIERRRIDFEPVEKETRRRRGRKKR